MIAGREIKSFTLYLGGAIKKSGLLLHLDCYNVGPKHAIHAGRVYQDISIHDQNTYRYLTISRAV